MLPCNNGCRVTYNLLVTAFWWWLSGDVHVLPAGIPPAGEEQRPPDIDRLGRLGRLQHRQPATGHPATGESHGLGTPGFAP